MAWYVESLVLDRERIKQKALNGVVVVDTNADGNMNESLFLHNTTVESMDGYDDFNVSIYLDADLDNSVFNDLLLIEKAISALLEEGELDLIHIKVLNVLAGGGSLVSMAQREGTDVNMLIKHFFTACNKISYELQGHFTDAGYMKYMNDKYNLDKQQIKKIAKYMQKSRRTRIRRLINDKATY